MEDETRITLLGLGIGLGLGLGLATSFADKLCHGTMSSFCLVVCSLVSGDFNRDWEASAWSGTMMMQCYSCTIYLVFSLKQELEKRRRMENSWVLALQHVLLKNWTEELFQHFAWLSVP